MSLENLKPETVFITPTDQPDVRMTARETMLGAIRAAKPDLVPLPEIPDFDNGIDDRTSAFTETLEAAGGQVVETQRDALAEAIQDVYPDVHIVASTVPEVEGNFDLPGVTHPRDLADVDLLVCQGALGVAENGAVWLGECEVMHRAAPFIAQHVALVVEKSTLVGTMHEAYVRLDVRADGFGVFVAGPSKTADIEQSLVIGAHGPRSLLVLLV